MRKPFEQSGAGKSARHLTNQVRELRQRHPPAKDCGLYDQLSQTAAAVTNEAVRKEPPPPAEKPPAYNYTRRACGEVRSMSCVGVANPFINVEGHPSRPARAIQSVRPISGLSRGRRAPS